jgi:flagellar M-ring protein FliF
LKEEWKEKLKSFAEKAKEKAGKISKKVYIAAVVVLVVAAAALVILLNNQPYAVLVTGVSTSEASSILTYLDSQGVTNYKVQNNDTILVPKGQEASLKAKILMEGYPQTGYAYSTYTDNVSTLSTEAERNNAYLMFLQESMSNTIRNFDNVKDATVYINTGEDRSYVLDSGNVVNATASVVVTMNDGMKLSTEQATAIRSLVAHAVQGLEIDSVDITDTLGNHYGAVDDISGSDTSALKLQLEEEYENKIRTEVLQTLIPFFGSDNVKVSVSCVVDVSQRTVNSREVYLDDWAADGSTGGRGIIGSRIYEYSATRPTDDTVGGVVGTETNSDIPEYVEDLGTLTGNETEITASGQTDYDNSYDETVAIYTAGYLTDCTISVSINSAAVGDFNINTIREHVARAAGITGDINETTGQEDLTSKISVVAMDFYNSVTETPDANESPFPVPTWVLLAALGGLLLFIVVLLVIILALRRRRRKQREAEEAEALLNQESVEEFLQAAGLNAEGEAATGADVMSMQTERSMELRKSIRQFASENPEICAQMVRAWLRGGGDDDG